MRLSRTLLAATKRGGAAPEIIAQVDAVEGAGTPPVTTINIPEAAEAGDFLLVVYMTRNASMATITNLTSGWSTTHITDGSTHGPRLFYKISDGSETSVTFTSASVSGAIPRSWLYVIRNASELVIDENFALNDAAPFDFPQVNVDKGALIFHTLYNGEDSATLPVTSWSNSLGRTVLTSVNYATTSGSGLKFAIGIIEMSVAGASGITEAFLGSGLTSARRATFAVQ